MGHNSKHGAYIRSLVKYDREYHADAEKRREHIQGIYINYQTAQDQLQTLNKLFEVSSIYCLLEITSVSLLLRTEESLRLFEGILRPP